MTYYQYLIEVFYKQLIQKNYESNENEKDWTLCLGLIDLENDLEKDLNHAD